jgi:hypothetical protein
LGIKIGIAAVDPSQRSIRSVNEQTARIAGPRGDWFGEIEVQFQVSWETATGRKRKRHLSRLTKAGQRVSGPIAGVLGAVFMAVANWTGAEPGREWNLIAGSVSSYLTGRANGANQRRALSCAKEATEGYGELLETGVKPLMYGWAATKCIAAWIAD